MAYYKLKDIITAALFLLSVFTTISIQAAKIRKYNYKTDYQATHALCIQHWKSFQEIDSSCGGWFDSLLLAFSDENLTVHPSQIGLKSKVLLKDKTVIGIVLYGYPAVAGKLLIERGIVSDESYGELAYIAIHKQFPFSNYKTQLFDSCKEEFLSQGIKTVLARSGRSDRMHIAWLKEQGFIALDPVTTSNHFEEACRLEAQAAKQNLYKLELKPRSSVNWDSWRGYLIEGAAALGESAETSFLSDLAQSLVAHMVAENTAHLGTPFTYDQRVYITRQYLRQYLEKQNTIKIIAYAFGLKPITPQTQAAIEEILEYIDDNMPALTDLMNSPEQQQKILDEASKRIH